MKTTIIYLIAKPGTGKYTIAKELIKFGYIVCDNQLINNPIFELVGYNGYCEVSDSAWNAIGKIRDQIFEFIIQEPQNNYVLTNCLFEDEGDRKLFDQVKDMTAKRGSLFIPVKLLISQEANLKRITNFTRKERWKSIDPKNVYSHQALLTIDHPHLLELNVTDLSAKEAAKTILDFVNGLKQVDVTLINQKFSCPDPLKTIYKLISERYSDAKTVFWAGSVSENRRTDASDLDLIIIYEHLPNAYREAFIYDKWPIDAFIHDFASLHYFLEESRQSSGISGTIHMITNGIEITRPNNLSIEVKNLAKKFLHSGPILWSKEKINKERFLITDILDDIKFPASEDSQIASAIYLYEPLAQFYFRAQGKWSASGKSIIRYLEKEDHNLANEFTQAFKKVFRSGDTDKLDKLVIKILEPYGGLLWDGFKTNNS